MLTAALAIALAGGGADASERARGLPIGGGSGGFKLDRIAGFDQPLYVHGPDGAGELAFVVERAGHVRVIEDGRKLDGSFLNITGRVETGGEGGLFSIAFPDWAGSRKLYVMYTDDHHDLRIDEYQRSATNPLDVPTGTRRRIMRIRQRGALNHNGGQLQFGPDGYLYASTGDGGGIGDPEENAQDRSSLLGKILRIDPSRSVGRRNYAIPAGNPFLGGPGRNEIYARGLRNPFKFSFDGGRIFIGDVGQERREEVDAEGPKGLRNANFGWDKFEGTRRYEGGRLRHHDKPIHQYSHAGGNCSITGGYVSRDERIPSLYGRYIYGDYCRGQLRSFKPKRGSRDDQSLGLPEQTNLTGFGSDESERIYVARQNGDVYRIVPD